MDCLGVLPWVIFTSRQRLAQPPPEGLLLALAEGKRTCIASAHMPLVKISPMATTNFKGHMSDHVSGRRRTKISVHSPDNHHPSPAHAHKISSPLFGGFLLNMNGEPRIDLIGTTISAVSELMKDKLCMTTLPKFTIVPVVRRHRLCHAVCNY